LGSAKRKRLRNTGIKHRIATPSSNYNKIIKTFVPDLSGKLQMLLIVALIFGSVGGLVVAAILKLLDNIVKVSVSKDY
jgi:hypothetical protein